MTPPWGINWQKYHQDQHDLPHIEAMGYRSFTIYEWHWSNRDAIRDLLSVARQDAIFLDRDHPKSEEKDDLWKRDPAAKGRAHADDWAQKVREGRVYTPLDRTFFLGLNEPDSNQYQRQIDAYNEAYCRRMAQHGLRAAAYSFGVGHPSTVGLQPKAPPDWSHYAASAAAVLEGSHLVALHEYGAPESYGWDYWCNRCRFCPYPFDVVLDECGIDYGVVKSGELYGWAKFMSPEKYLEWLDGFQLGMAERAPTRKVNILAYNLFSYDHGDGKNKDWHSFDIRPLRGKIENYPWRVVQPADKDHSVHVPIVGGPQPPDGPPKVIGDPWSSDSELEQPKRAKFVWPAKGVTTQRFGERVDYYLPAFGSHGHNGLDIAAPLGTPVCAAADGVVAWVDTDLDYGKYIRIWHEALGFHSFYAHLDKALVTQGQAVRAGQRIGDMGSTGNSTGPHLHFEVRLGTGLHAYGQAAWGHTRGRVDPETVFAVLGVV